MVITSRVNSVNDDSYIINEQQSDEDNEEERPGQLKQSDVIRRVADMFQKGKR